MSLLLQGVFMALWTIGVAVALRMNTSWLWPDPLRRPWYPVLSSLSVAGLLLWGLVAYRYGLVGAATLGILLPAGLWLVTCAVLYRPLPEGEKPKAWSQLRRDYRLAGALLLTATAVVPGASFFALSYDMHVGGFLKGRQIALARAVDGGAPCKAGWTGDDPVAMRARYDEVFYKSVTCLKGETPIKTPAEEAAEAESEPWGIHSLVEEYLPYYTSTSIETRELLHDHANDNTWVSTRLPDGQMTVDVAARAPGYRVKVQSPVPAALGIRSLGERPRIVWAAVMALALLIVGLVASVRWIMNYLLRHVLLADIVEPARPKLPVELAVGQNLLVICDDPAAQAKALTENSEASIFELTRILTAENPGAEWRRTRVALGSANTVAPLVIHDVTDAMDDPALMLKKLALVDQLMGDLEQTVVLLAKYPTYVLAAAAKDAARGNADSDRWPKLVARLTVIDIRTSPQSQQELSGTAAVVSWRERLAQLWAAWTKPPAEDWQSELISVEAGRNRKLRRICEELQRTLAFQSRELTCEQILEELAERAAPYYQRLWQGCDPDERVVLEHVAQVRAGERGIAASGPATAGEGPAAQGPEPAPDEPELSALRLDSGVPQRSRGARGAGRAERVGPPAPAAGVDLTGHGPVPGDHAARGVRRHRRDGGGRDDGRADPGEADPLPDAAGGQEEHTAHGQRMIFACSNHAALDAYWLWASAL